MHFSLLFLLAINALVVVADPNPIASPEALAEASPEALPEALPEPVTVTTTSKAPATCPSCPAVLQQAVSPFANVPLVQSFCALNSNGTVSSNSTCQNFGSLLVKDAQLFCCCLWPATNGTKPNSTKSTRDLEGKPGLFRRMWHAWTGETSEPSMPVTLGDAVLVEKGPSTRQGLRTIGGGSLIRHHGLALSLDTVEGVALTLEIPDISV